MAIQQFTGRVEESKILASTFHWIQIELQQPHRMEFVAGQYVLVSIPGSELKRQYSIASPPNAQNEIDLLVDCKPQGIGSKYFQNIQPGQEVAFMGPAGMFVLEKLEEKRPIIFVATGSGISPMRSMLLHLLQTEQDDRPIWLYWGLRFVEDLFWEEDFRMLHDSFPNFQFIPVLSKPPEHWPLVSGHVTQVIQQNHQDMPQLDFYLCGNKRMIEEMKSILAENLVPSTQIHFEKFF